jgi:hypothetical protein
LFIPFISPRQSRDENSHSYHRRAKHADARDVSLQAIPGTRFTGRTSLFGVRGALVKMRLCFLVNRFAGWVRIQRWFLRLLLAIYSHTLTCLFSLDAGVGHGNSTKQGLPSKVEKLCQDLLFLPRLSEGWVPIDLSDHPGTYFSGPLHLPIPALDPLQGPFAAACHLPNLEQGFIRNFAISCSVRSKIFFNRILQHYG